MISLSCIGSSIPEFPELSVFFILFLLSFKLYSQSILLPSSLSALISISLFVLLFSFSSNGSINFSFFIGWAFLSSLRFSSVILLLLTLGTFFLFSFTLLKLINLNQSFLILI